MKQRIAGRAVWLFLVVALVAAGAGIWLAGTLERAATPRVEAPQPVDQSTLRDGPLLRLPEPRPIADFALYDRHGDPFSRADLEDRWSLAFFGFSSCPHICPDTLFQLTRAAESLPEGQQPRVWFIGVDPERDTPERLDEYAERFGGDLVATSGPDAQLRALAMQLGVHYNVPEHEPGEWYNVDHSMDVLLIDPQGRWAGVLKAPHDGEAIAGAVGRHIGTPVGTSPAP